MNLFFKEASFIKNPDLDLLKGSKIRFWVRREEHTNKFVENDTSSFDEIARRKFIS